MGRSQKIGSRVYGDPLRTYGPLHPYMSSPIKSFSSNLDIVHLSPSGPWIGPYNIKSPCPFGRPTLKENIQFGPYKWAYGLYIARHTLRPTF